MPHVNINRDELRERIHGCWLGKNIGGTLGGPFEGRTDVLEVTGYTTPAGEPLPNDDLDLQLVWLKAIEERGPLGVNAPVLGEYWLNFISPYWNEYGMCKANMRAGLVPPMSGEYRNEQWKHSNGAWIRSEIWACLAPGCPDIAVRFAREDACVDHGAGEGTFAALFTAAVQSAAFVISDRDELIRIGLAHIPDDCRVARAISVAMKAYERGATWQEARRLVVEDSADLGWFQAPANVAFVIIGWLYGEGDFGKSICIATSCGDDTDCTAATLGATLGILCGASAIPEKWTAPIGDRILTIAVDRGSFAPPARLGDLTDRVLAQAPATLAAFHAGVAITDAPTDLAGIESLRLKDGTFAKTIWTRSPWATTHDFIHTEVTLDYGQAPEVSAGTPVHLSLRLVNRMPDPRPLQLTWRLPDGWTVTPGPQSHVTLGHTRPVRELEFDIYPGQLDAPEYRGVLEIVAPGRHTVGLVPLLFLNAI